MARTPLIAGNWKMHGDTEQVNTLLEHLAQQAHTINDRTNLAVFPPFPYLAQTRALLQSSPICWGGQNLSEHASGAYTGEVSGGMLRDIGCTYVLVGHSERRALYHESDTTVAEKFHAAHNAGLTPVLCVGETLQARENQQTHQVIAAQLDAIIVRNGIQALNNSVIAYEPVWAIGTGKTATPDQAQEAHAFIRQHLQHKDAKISGLQRILYGGSVKGSNARALLAMPDVDGALVGGASLDGAEFMTIARSV